MHRSCAKDDRVSHEAALYQGAHAGFECIELLQIERCLRAQVPELLQRLLHGLGRGNDRRATAEGENQDICVQGLECANGDGALQPASIDVITAIHGSVPPRPLGIEKEEVVPVEVNQDFNHPIRKDSIHRLPQEGKSLYGGGAIVPGLPLSLEQAEAEQHQQVDRQADQKQPEQVDRRADRKQPEQVDQELGRQGEEVEQEEAGL
ncbi:hypothetical protein PG990_006824 [Apiospora arundinis]